ncbi:MAG: hypothetical protein ACYS80_17645, partial [Planctomycetota bacterium]
AFLPKRTQAELIESFIRFILSEIFVIKQQVTNNKNSIYLKQGTYSKYQSKKVFASIKTVKT